MSLKITHKNSTAAGTPPAAGDIDVGEIAINAADAELYTKDLNGNIRKFQNTTTGTAGGVKFTQAGSGAVQRTVDSKLKDVVSVKDFGAVGDGVADDTVAINAFLAKASQDGLSAYWGETNSTYLVTASLPLFRTVVHIGKARVQRGSDIFHIGSAWRGAQNIVYVSPAGGGDGLTSDSALGTTNAFDFVRRMASLQAHTKWRLQYAPGTYNNPNHRFENWPNTTYPVEFFGAVVASPADPDRPEPSVVFDGSTASTDAFRTLGAVVALHIDMQNLKFINFSGDPITLQGHENIASFANIHGDNNSGSFLIRGGTIAWTKGIISNSDAGIVCQNVYGYVGAGAGNNPEDGTVFNDITGTALDISRGSVMYARRNVFTNVGTGISLSRVSRCRRLSNTFNSWTNSAISIEDPTSRLDDGGTTDLDTFSGGAFRQAAISTNGSPYLQRNTISPDWSSHLIYDGPPIVLTGTFARAEISTASEGGSDDLSPFRMPEWWLRSPTAGGLVRMWLSVDHGGSILLEIAGTGGATADVIISHTVASDALSGTQILFVEMEFCGPSAGTTDNRGFTRSHSFRDGQPPAMGTGRTALLNRSSITGSSNNEKKFRLYATIPEAGKNVTIQRQESFFRL
jgi:hypothetical protein